MLYDLSALRASQDGRWQGDHQVLRLLAFRVVQVPGQGDLAGDGNSQRVSAA